MDLVGKLSDPTLMDDVSRLATQGILQCKLLEIIKTYSLAKIMEGHCSTGVLFSQFSQGLPSTFGVTNQHRRRGSVVC